MNHLSLLLRPPHETTELKTIVGFAWNPKPTHFKMLTFAWTVD